MKILHTSDWHLGHTLYNYDRTEEQMAMLVQMVNIVKEQKPDVFLLCGDVYHTSQPSASVQTLFTEALIKIRDANPDMTIVVTAGNHDSGTKHEIFRTPWRALKVHTVGKTPTLTHQDEKKDCWYDDYVIEVPGKGFVVAVPYCNERNIPKGFFTALTDAVKERNSDNLPVIMSAHTTVRGCDFTGHDNASEYVVGGIDAVSIDELGDGYDYLALGHIHHAQFVHTGKHNVRYSGTPIAISFDENYEHSVTIIKIDKHKDKPKVSTIEIHNPRPLVTLPTEGTTTWDKAKQLLADFPNDIPAYIRLNVEIDDFLPTGANEESQQLAKDKACRFCHINAKRKAAKQTDSKVLTVQEFQSEEPIDIARHYAADTGFVFDEEMTALFNETLRMINTESRL